MSVRSRARRLRLPGGSRLGRLDDRLVPPLAARTQRSAARASATGSTARAAAAGRVPPPAPGPGARRTERLDARLTRRGPLAVLRVLPALGLLLATLVLGAAVVSAVITDGSDAASPQGTAAGAPEEPGAPVDPDPDTAPDPDTEADLFDTTGLGPEPGQPVAEHLAEASEALSALVQSDPDTPRLALIHLEQYTDPERTATAVAGVEPLRALVRVPLPGVQTAVTPVTARNLPEDLVLAMSSLAPRRLAVAETDEAGAPTGPEGQAQRDSAAAARLEASQLQGGCACVVGVVVRASPRQLEALEGRPGLRGIVPGPTGVAPESLVLRPLLPEQTDVATPPGTP